MSTSRRPGSSTRPSRSTAAGIEVVKLSSVSVARAVSGRLAAVTRMPPSDGIALRVARPPAGELQRATASRLVRVESFKVGQIV